MKKLLFFGWLLGAFFSTIVDAQEEPRWASVVDIMRLAVQKHPTILSRQFQQEAARSDLMAAKLRFLPSPSLSRSQTRSSLSISSAATTTPTTTFTLTQPLWWGGALTAGYDRGAANLASAEWGVAEGREDVALRVLSSYADWYRTNTKISAAEEALGIHNRLMDLITNRHEAGIAAQVDKDLASSRLAQVRADLSVFRSAEKAVLTELSLLLDMEVTREQLLSIDPSPANIEGFNQAQLLDRAKQVNPTIRRLELDAVATQAQIQESAAQGYPQISLQLSRQLNAGLAPNVYDVTTFGVVASIAPGGGLSSFATAQSARERYQAALTQVETARREVTNRFNRDLNDYQFALARRDDIKSSLDLSSEISTSYDRLYLVGRRSWIDLMNAVRERAQALYALADIDATIFVSSQRLRIYYAGAPGNQSTNE